MTLTVNIQTVEVHIHQADTLAIAAVLADIQGKVGIIMATTAEALVVLGEINAATDEIAADLETAASKPDVPAEVHDAMVAAATRLRGVASSFPPVAGAPVPETPGSEPLPA